MKARLHDNQVAPFIEVGMPHATPEERLLANFEFWEFFDAVWSIADRIVTEREVERAARDKSTSFDTVESSPHV